jgi:hypothetical protein
VQTAPWPLFGQTQHKIKTAAPTPLQSDQAKNTATNFDDKPMQHVDRREQKNLQTGRPAKAVNDDG